MLVKLVGHSVRLNAARTLASQANPLPMPKCDFTPDKYTVMIDFLF